jgi:hypothetical protein
MLKRILALAIVALALPAAAAVPGQVDFQGLLLDSGGQKVNGAVDLVFTLYDAPTGGTALWTESHPDVQVSDGVYGVTLGTTTPLTPTILGSGNVHLQISVDGETLTPRRQLLAVPYAVRAQTAENSESVAGVAGGFYNQLIEDVPFDGGNPPNLDPSEGFGDTDGDGLANFVDPDNDADNISDVNEVAQGSSINLTTPVIATFAPQGLKISDLPATIHVTGSNFEAGITVTVNGTSVVPINVSPTAFDVVFPTQTASLANVVVTRVNGQSDLEAYLFKGRRVFIASGNTGNLGGIAGADAKCATRASQLSLTGTFRAWLSDATTSPASRFLQDDVHYERHPDRVKIADNWADLTDGTLDAPIVATGGNLAWTGTASNGNPLGGNCANWTSNSSVLTGRGGVTSLTNATWSALNTDAGCNSVSVDLYCFEQ